MAYQFNRNNIQIYINSIKNCKYIVDTHKMTTIIINKNDSVYM